MIIKDDEQHEKESKEENETMKNALEDEVTGRDGKDDAIVRDDEQSSCSTWSISSSN